MALAPRDLVRANWLHRQEPGSLPALPVLSGPDTAAPTQLPHHVLPVPSRALELYASEPKGGALIHSVNSSGHLLCPELHCRCYFFSLLLRVEVSFLLGGHLPVFKGLTCELIQSSIWLQVG